MFTVKQMRYFDALATHLHFRKAAETVFISQPALSAQIAEMENLAGSPLFERANKSVLLTELGQTLWPRIKVILQEIRALEELTEQKSGILQSRLRLGIIPTIAPYLLPDLIQSLKQQYPALTLELREALTDKLLEELRNGELDAVIAAMPVHDPHLTSAHLFDDRFLIATSANNNDVLPSPLTQGNAALEKLLLLEEGHCLRDQALEVCAIPRERTLVNFGATSMATLLQMVSNDMGLTLIPEIAIRSEVPHKRIRIIPFSDDCPRRQVGLFWRKQSLRLADFNALVVCVRQCTAKIMLQPDEFAKLRDNSSNLN
ncbi:hydrogen peroxide-inducible genes activator [Pseudochrobactrum asaccharolyticum]|uniref:LysR family hydrogen peroxide-inducible transcriptional activator n=1 Tax=Pseudochrobactrum asaccharolyticum TaxID=354351 RepID=A0A366EAR7_9HYPH|nr:hydrogen peroxide-inducible genes activator [Pseudochrobactrum asaccharolyticum]RBO98564.1 LysR family hydrogen peroxide-inducible transcriptional activator [Pseudochrobactrum asaccharolyticum]